MERLFSKFREKGLSVIGVSLDEDIEVLRSYLTGRTFSFSIATDQDKKLRKKLGIKGIPVAVGIGKSGKIRFTRSGSFSSLEQHIERWLDE